MKSCPVCYMPPKFGDAHGTNVCRTRPVAVRASHAPATEVPEILRPKTKPPRLRLVATL